MSFKKKQSSPKLTAEIAGEIKMLWNETSLNQAQIAAKLGALNQGRVSEVINGHRFADIPAADFEDLVPEDLVGRGKFEGRHS